MQLLYKDLKTSLSVRLLCAKVMNLICLSILAGMFPLLYFIELGTVV